MKKSILSESYISSFCMELYLILHAGITVSEGISMILEGEENKDAKEVLSTIHEKMEMGEQLSSAIKATEGFPKYTIDMIEIGERTGRLDSVLKALSSYYARQDEIEKTIKNAIIYPVILLVMMLFVVIILITKVLPIFSQVFSQLGSTMSPVAQSIMGIGTFINNNMIVFIVLVVILFGVFFYLFATEKGKDRIIGLFSFGKTGNYIETAFFASAMSMALQSGLDADESLSLAENLLSGTKMTSKIKNCQQLIVDGKTFADAIAKSDIFSPLYCRMLDIGFKTGSSDTVMEEIAIRTEKAANEKIDSVIAGIEPILVIIMSVTVGLILLSVMLPLMNIMSSIG